MLPAVTHYCRTGLNRDVRSVAPYPSQATDRGSKPCPFSPEPEFRIPISLQRGVGCELDFVSWSPTRREPAHVAGLDGSRTGSNSHRAFARAPSAEPHPNRAEAVPADRPS